MRLRYSTPRLSLKTLNPAMAFAVSDYYKRNAEFFKPWRPATGNKPDYRALLQTEQRDMLHGKSFVLWVFKKNRPERIIGKIIFFNILCGSFNSCTLAYSSDKDEINKGYMTEALKKAINIAFNRFNLHRIEANIMPENAPSLALIKKLGFNYEGYSNRFTEINGTYRDHCRFALLNERQFYDRMNKTY